MRLGTLFLIITVLALAGSLGFMLTEGISFFDAIYLTVITISTVGYGDVTPTTFAGKVLAMVLVMLGVAIFLGVVAEGTQLLLQRREEPLRQRRVQILMGLFFGELGNDLLNFCASSDPKISEFHKSLDLDEKTGEVKFASINSKLATYSFTIDSSRVDFAGIKQLLVLKGEQLMRLLENPSLQARESFTELLRNIFHLREELVARKDLSGLPQADIQHLTGDLERVYPLLAGQWLGYMKYLAENFEFLYSLALRTNPFNPSRSALVEK